ncbi:MAG TPA: DUF1028 domain-containing protein [Anaerolineae bacterium]|nr:DUF1028 domain-containing protein [Anaerolineae bacterium]
MSIVPPDKLFATYSIVARDAATGQLGMAVETHQMCVGSVVPWLLPGVGALATQSLVNISFGPIGLAMLREGVPAPKVIEALIASDAQAHVRQVAAVDAQGRVGAWTGERCIREASHRIGEGYSVQANMMTQNTVVPAMAQAYEQTTGNLAERMLAALQAAQREGGDIRGMQSAALKIVEGKQSGVRAWETIYDLRVDEHADPPAELGRLVRLRSAQVLDAQGYETLKAGERAAALETWRRAREMAPELEETGFWQALTLADEHSDVQTAAEIFNRVFKDDDRRAYWIDLIGRLQNCGSIERSGAGDELIAALS